ncbi:MAG: carboxypeptidase family protein [Oceanospirillaceae bacterium]|nr:carboxypeptidase family protein [Oceanospirillaceae bacterium]
MNINCQFDSGNIHVIDSQSNPVKLAIRHDHQSDFYQWFHFCVSGAQAQENFQFSLTNAAGAAFAQGWNHFQVVASYDRQEWFRVATHYEQGELIFDHAAEYDQVWYSFFTPYSWERHQDLIAWAQTSALCSLETLGNTLDNRPLSLLTVGQPGPEKRNIWLTARQHPGETMAEFAIEGLLQKLLDPADACGRKLLENAVFYIIPNMNPDGSIRGHLRTNAAGVNLNREWDSASMERSPEVYLTQQKMRETGVDLFIDCHGDEEIPYVFLVDNQGIPAYGPRLATLEDKFKQQLLISNPDYQTQHGYETDLPGQANLTLASASVGQTYDCLALTLEMPFIDNFNLPDATYGWSAQRSSDMGAALLPAMLAVIDELR